MSAKRTQRDECSTCFEFYTMYNPKITCSKCNTSVCLNDLIRYMNSNKIFPRCSNRDCEKAFDEFSLCKDLTSNQIKKLRPSIKKIILEDAKSHLPRIVAKIEKYGYVRTMIKNPNHDKTKQAEKRRLSERMEAIVNFVKKIHLDNPFYIIKPIYLRNNNSGDVQYHINKFNKRNLSWTNRDHVKILIEEFKVYYQELKIRRQALRDLPGFPVKFFVYKDITGAIHYRTNVLMVKSQERQNILPCPYSGCPGFLSSMWKCLTCHKYCCDKCNEPKNEDHQCKPENIASADLIRAETIRCPKCVSPVFRAFGCDKMFCTKCETSFLYTTLEIIPHTQNSSPDFNRWASQNGGVPISNICPGETQFPKLKQLKTILSMSEIPFDDVEYAIRFHRLVNPDDYFKIPNQELVYEKNLDLLLEKFVANLITEKSLQRQLFENHRRDQRYMHTNSILDSFRTAGNMLLWRMIACDTKSGFDEVHAQIKNLIIFTNEAFRLVCKTLDYERHPFICCNLRYHRSYNINTKDCESDLTGYYDREDHSKQSCYKHMIYSELYTIGRDRPRPVTQGQMVTIGRDPSP